MKSKKSLSRKEKILLNKEVKNLLNREVIDKFANRYDFLSNFYSAPVEYEGLVYRNNEAAFQSAKTVDMEERKRFVAYAPSVAKLEGRNLFLRSDWEEVKDGVMYDVVKDKFTRNPDLKKRLLNTGEAVLIEGNWWHDNYWGNCTCLKCLDIPGKNQLGITLMKVREELEEEKLSRKRGRKPKNKNDESENSKNENSENEND